MNCQIMVTQHSIVKERRGQNRVQDKLLKVFGKGEKVQ